jgi:hypothetical protein
VSSVEQDVGALGAYSKDWSTAADRSAVYLAGSRGALRVGRSVPPPPSRSLTARGARIGDLRVLERSSERRRRFGYLCSTLRRARQPDPAPTLGSPPTWALHTPRQESANHARPGGPCGAILNHSSTAIGQVPGRRNLKQALTRANARLRRHAARLSHIPAKQPAATRHDGPDLVFYTVAGVGFEPT